MKRTRIGRRSFLGGAVAAAAGYGLLPRSARAAKAPERPSWSNWSGAVKCSPGSIESPPTEEALIGLVRKAKAGNRTVRIVGSGHSCVPLCAVDDGVLLTLNGIRGIVGTDEKAREAVVRGGSVIYQLGRPLRRAGLAMECISDIATQTITGAIGTSTHGTGHGVRTLSNQIAGLRLVTAEGDILECSEDRNPEILKAAQVSLGALGVITQVRMRLVPAFRLHERQWRVSFDECFEALPELIAENRHFEFFWVSGMDACLMKTLNPTDAEPDKLEDQRGERIGHSDEIFPSVRSMKFNEIEFSLPEKNGPDCLLELRELLKTRHSEVAMPLEYRTVGADDLYLSMAEGRDTVTISAHRVAAKDPKRFFGDVEAIFRNHNGRPHWGKMHTHTASDLAALYPQWDAFQKVRQDLDPKGRFLSPYLRKLLLA